jgi:hypothetical protein
MIIVYVDESGSPSSASPDPNFPIFVMAACVFEPNHYAQRLAPALCALKLRYFGSDSVILHESETRKRLGVFCFPNTESRRERFLADVTEIVREEVTGIVAVVTKPSPQRGDLTVESVEALCKLLSKTETGAAHWVFEKRGKREDATVHATMQRIAGLDHTWEFAPKLRGLPGLEMADMIARPIGLGVLRPNQQNRALELIKARVRLLIQ